MPPEADRMTIQRVHHDHHSPDHHKEQKVSIDTETVLMDYIKKELLRNRSAAITPEDDLLANGTIDSLGILQLVAFVDESFGVRVPDEDVTYENFHSVRALSDYLSRLR
jgi:acyl carrier protein